MRNREKYTARLKLIITCQFESLTRKGSGEALVFHGSRINEILLLSKRKGAVQKQEVVVKL